MNQHLLIGLIPQAALFGLLFRQFDGWAKATPDNLNTGQAMLREETASQRAILGGISYRCYPSVWYYGIRCAPGIF